MKGILLLLSFTFLLLTCQKAREVKEEPIKPEPVVIQDEELEKWKATLIKEIYTIDINKVPNPFMTSQTYKLLAQKEETIPLELVGIVQKKDRRIALLQDPTKKGFIVKVGDKLGTSLIKEIGPDYLIIEDTVANILGVKTKKTRKITLKKENL